MGKSEGEDYKQSVRYAKAQEERKEKFFQKLQIAIVQLWLGISYCRAGMRRSSDKRARPEGALCARWLSSSRNAEQPKSSYRTRLGCGKAFTRAMGKCVAKQEAGSGVRHKACLWLRGRW